MAVLDYKIGCINLIVLAVIISACDLVSVEKAPDYPFKVPEVELSELQKMNEEFQAGNNGHICSTLNEYGKTGFSRILFPDDVNPCLLKENVRVELTVEDTLITNAKKTLLANSKYTGVEDTAALRLVESIPLYGCTICEGPDINNVPIEWKLTFDKQQLDGAKVADTEIVVVADAKGVNRIIGNWYPDFEAPDLVNYGIGYAEEVLIGWQFDMRRYTGEEKIFTVRQRNLSGPVKAIFPVTQDEYLELRKCWVVSISYEQEEFSGWKAVIDMIDGSLLKVTPSDSLQL